ncbi:MucBP domain-containing protein [Carnobacterium maltaromaticum]
MIRLKLGLPYQSTAKSIDGWVVKTTPGNVAGTFIDKAQESSTSLV